jgi:hypothetical protein
MALSAFERVIELQLGRQAETPHIVIGLVEFLAAQSENRWSQSRSTATRPRPLRSIFRKSCTSLRELTPRGNADLCSD